MLLLDLEAKRAWYKISFSNSERVLVQNQFQWLESFTEMRPELIPIIAFVPFHFCRVLLKIQPSRQNRHGKAAQSAAQTVRAATAIGCAARAVCAVRPVRPVCADRASFPAVPS